jgi:acetyltransferase
MINSQLLNPSSIVVVGGSSEIHKPGGKLLKNLLDGNFNGKLYVVNRKEKVALGTDCFESVNDLPPVDLAFIAIPAKNCIEVITVLTESKNTRAFVIISAGFSESGSEGKAIEKKIVEIVKKVDGALIGPNCIGVITPAYKGVFTQPIPPMDPKSIDLISGSGATAVFILDVGVKKGLKFANIFSVGNSAQIGVEEVLKYMDENFNPDTSPKIKLLYLEDIDNPNLLLKHASSLIRKGCRIAAIKAGSSEAGSRAASSHTGAIATSDVAVDALFKKAGIVRCYGRDELVSVACAFMYPKAKGKNFAIITHAGGPAVMLTDTLSKYGLNVPLIKNEYAQFLLDELNPGSSVSNPIDFLSTGTASQLDSIIEYVNKKFDEIDAMIIIFGTPGLFKIFDAYQVIHEKIATTLKPIYPVLPSEIVAEEEVLDFISKGHVYFHDEVLLGTVLGRIYNMPDIETVDVDILPADKSKIRMVIDNNETGYLLPADVQNLMDAVEIPRVKEIVVTDETLLFKAVHKIKYPLVMKVIGPVHKTDVGGVVPNIKDDITLIDEFRKMMKIPEVTGILLQPMLSGIELFMGAKYEKTFGHMILCGLGGIYIELLRDVAPGLAPLSKNEALMMIRSLKSYKIFKGIRGKKPVNEDIFANIMLKLSTLLQYAPEIEELDFNPILANGDDIVLVDARVKIRKSSEND